MILEHCFKVLFVEAIDNCRNYILKTYLNWLKSCLDQILTAAQLLLNFLRQRFYKMMWQGTWHSFKHYQNLQKRRSKSLKKSPKVIENRLVALSARSAVSISVKMRKKIHRQS